MHNLDAAIVIPAHKEGKGILHTLASIATQRGVSPDRLGVFVTINNASNADEKVKAINRETAELIRALMSGVSPIGLSNRKRLVMAFDERLRGFHETVSEVEAARLVIRALSSFLVLEEVNLWENEQAPEVCNVGVARDLGTRAAIRHLKSEDCPVMHTDADTLLHPDKVRKVIDAFRKDPLLMALRGETCQFSPFDKMEDFEQYFVFRIMGFINYITSLQNSLEIMLIEQNYIPRQFFEPPRHIAEQIHADRLIMAGPDTAFRANVYNDAQFPHIPGDEDTQFSSAVRRAGNSIHLNSSLLSAVESRFSERASTGHGRSLLVYRKYCADPAKIPLTSIERFGLFRDVTVRFIVENGLVGIEGAGQPPRFNPGYRELFIPYLKSHGFDINPMDAFIILDILANAGTTTNFSRRLISKIEKGEICGDLGFTLPINEALEEIIQILKDDPRLRRGPRGQARKKLIEQATQCQKDLEAFCRVAKNMVTEIRGDQDDSLTEDAIAAPIPQIACR